MFAEASSFETIDFNNKEKISPLAKQGFNATIDEAMRVMDKNGNFAGYVLTVTNHEGYGGDIQFAMGVKADGTVNGISFLSISETAGLGMKAAEDDFKKQFANKKAASFVYTTITTNAVTNGVNAGLFYISTLEEEGQDNE